ncbi:protein yellow-like [Bacillus rossius redtenbacheri]|uniref:protein yellow-like n=1 Tax=Bacillus rossius redtenbacheri TaxID=93214 RepID=UPI002FDE5A97
MAKARGRRQLWPAVAPLYHQERYQFTPALQTPAYNQLGALWLPWLLAAGLATTNYQQAPRQGLTELYRWKQVDLQYPSPQEHAAALSSGEFVPANNLPLGLDCWGDRVFLTLPRWKPTGVPVTLATVPRSGGGESPPLRPYPSWAWHRGPGCERLTSVFRVNVDPCGRLWVLDSGLEDVASGSPRQRCPPQLLVFDLATDTLLHRYRLPREQVKEGSLFSNVVVDVRAGRCDDAHAYLADVWRFALVVYRLRDDTSWRVDHPLFFPEPASCRYDVHGLVFRWTDGVFGLGLSPEERGDRTLFFHAMSSGRECAVPASVLRNQSAVDEMGDLFAQLGEPRYPDRAQASASGVDRRGVLFYNLVSRDAVGCWNTRQPRGHVADLQGVVAADGEALRFPNDLKVDHGERQAVWVLSNRLHQFLYAELDPAEHNFRVLTGWADELTRDTVCDPDYVDVPPREDLAPRLVCPV